MEIKDCISAKQQLATNQIMAKNATIILCEQINIESYLCGNLWYKNFLAHFLRLIMVIISNDANWSSIFILSIVDSPALIDFVDQQISLNLIMVCWFVDLKVCLLVGL